MESQLHQRQETKKLTGISSQTLGMTLARWFCFGFQIKDSALSPVAPAPGRNRGAH
jgi:hypothetical protein